VENDKVPQGKSIGYGGRKDVVGIVNMTDGRILFWNLTHIS
jgi:hypothetical protein